MTIEEQQLREEVQSGTAEVLAVLGKHDLWVQSLILGAVEQEGRFQENLQQRQEYPLSYSVRWAVPPSPSVRDPASS